MQPGSQHRINRRAFSLIEIIIVVSVLSILAAIVLPRIAGAKEKANAVAAGQSMMAIAQAAEHYYATHGEWPADRNRRQIPPELVPYLPTESFTNAPLNGVWDFDVWLGQSYTAGGDKLGVCISIVEGDPSLYEAVDREIDDGDLTTGTIRYCESSPRLVYVLRFQ
ncbi:MAG: type II secretion system protein [Phycisphaerales bacterium JB063]